MGAPNKEVIALIGNVNSLVGNCAMLSQISNTIPPMIAEAGTNILWLDVENNIFEICGTAKPIKAIGPEKAVMTPVNKLVITKTIFLLFLMLIPKHFA